MPFLKAAALVIGVAPILFAAKHPRTYRTAQVLDANVRMHSQITGARTSSSGNNPETNTTGMTSSNTVYDSVTVRTNELVLAGDDYYYVVADSRAQYTNPGWALVGGFTQKHHGCRFIVGEPVQYAQEKGVLHVIDVDGKECSVSILRQEKR